MTSARSGGRLLADQLARQGCELCFCVPGESYLALLDGLFEHRGHVRVVTCRHETAAANAAEAYGKLTGRPGVCMVTRGPGATQAAVGVHTARQDSTPLILLVGQVARGHRGREAFQEIDCEALFGSMTKGVFELDNPERIPEIMASAFSLAAGGRQGPVVVSLPEDVLAAPAEARDAPRYVAREPTADPASIDELRRALQVAERPLVLVGGGPWDDRACAALDAWASACDLPVAAAFRRQDLVDNERDHYVGDVGLGINPKLARRIASADLLIAAGPRLTEVETQGYTLPAPPFTPQTLIHVHPDPHELGRVYQPALGILSGMRAFASAIDAGARVDGRRWREWTASARGDYESWSTPTAADPGEGVDLGEVMSSCARSFPGTRSSATAPATTPCGCIDSPATAAGAPSSPPRAEPWATGSPPPWPPRCCIPDRPVVALAGDGCFQMCGQELATMVQEGLPILVIVANNRMLGTIRMHQERRFPGRVMSTGLVNPDFAAYARSFGLHAERVEDSGAFAGACSEPATPAVRR